MNITVFEKNNCIQCTQTKKWLVKNSIPFNTANVETDNEALQYVLNLGYKAAPVIVVTDDNQESAEHWSGFNPDKLETLKNKEGDK